MVNLLALRTAANRPMREEIYFFKWNLDIFNLPFEGNFRLVLNGDIGSLSLVNKVHFLVMLKVEGCQYPAWQW